MVSSWWTPTWFQILHSSMWLGGSRCMLVIPRHTCLGSGRSLQQSPEVKELYDPCTLMFFYKGRAVTRSLQPSLAD